MPPFCASAASHRQTLRSWASSRVPDGKDFRATGRAPVHAIGEAAHLGVTALAGMTAHGVRQFGYPAERIQERPTDEAPAGLASGGVASEGSELVHLAKGAAEGAGPGACRTFHSLFLPVSLLEEPRVGGWTRARPPNSASSACFRPCQNLRRSKPSNGMAGRWPAGTPLPFRASSIPARRGFMSFACRRQDSPPRIWYTPLFALRPA